MTFHHNAQAQKNEEKDESLRYHLTTGTVTMMSTVELLSAFFHQMKKVPVKMDGRLLFMGTASSIVGGLTRLIFDQEQSRCREDMSMNARLSIQ